MEDFNLFIKFIGLPITTQVKWVGRFKWGECPYHEVMKPFELSSIDLAVLII